MSYLSLLLALVIASPLDPSSADTQPRLDPAIVGRAIGRLAHHGTVFAVSPNGVALTAYHAISECVVRLRKDPNTASLFNPDGSYRGKPLRCPGLMARFPSEDCASLGPLRNVSLLAVPAENDRLLSAPARNEVPAPRDFALVEIDPAPETYLRLSSGPPRLGAHVWAVGYPVGADRPQNETESLIRALEIVRAAWEVRLDSLLVQAATDSNAAAKGARDALDDYQTKLPELPHLREAQGIFMEKTLARFERMSQGAEQAISEVRRTLEEMANARQGQAEEPYTEPRIAEELRAEADSLRRLATSSSGPEVEAVMIELHQRSVAVLERLDAERTEAPEKLDRACMAVARPGVIKDESSFHIHTDAGAAPGMSGGPMLSADGTVVGILHFRTPDRLGGLAEGDLVGIRGDVVWREYRTTIDGSRD